MKYDCSLSLKRSVQRFLFYTSICAFPVVHANVSEVEPNLLDLSLEDLMNIEVTSVSKRGRALVDAPAAIYVVTEEDIRRSGVSSIPDALRMVPGMHVARIDGNKWAISSRGFTGRFANKLLVLIDGRTVYTPSFSGVYWEDQDVVLQDIERIEVIRGPGASLWGSNAVNGVINIITKSAHETSGTLLATRYSSIDELQLAGRYGGRTQGGAAYRVYGKHQETGEFASEFGGTASDRKETSRAGFRLDTPRGEAAGLTLQGEIFDSSANQLLLDNVPSSPTYRDFVDDPIDEQGWHILGRWTVAEENGAGFTAQLYVDQFERTEDWQDESRTIYDADIQYQAPSLRNHRITLGGGYRVDDHETRATQKLIFNPADRSSDIISFFVQDEIAFLEERLNLVVGSKFEHSDYSPNDIDIQPSLRVAYQLNEHVSLWGAASRALRSPSRAEREAEGHVATRVDGPVPLVVIALGNENLEPEQLTAYELGFRTILFNKLALDLAVFKNDYEDLRGIEPSAVTFEHGQLLIKSTLNSAGQIDSHGLELAFDWTLSPDWRLKGAYSYIDIDRNVSGEGFVELNEQPDTQQFNVRSQYNLTADLSLDLWLRYVDDIEGTEIDSYSAVDARLSWRPRHNVELALIGSNLFNDDNREFLTEFVATEGASVQQSITAELVLTF